MTAKERQRLQKAIQLLSGPFGDRNRGWKILRELAGLEPEPDQPPLGARAARSMRKELHEYTD